MVRRGVGEAHGAVSIINAISTGFGVALGVDFHTRAVAEPIEGGETVLVNRDLVGDDSLVKEVVRVVVELVGRRGLGFRVVTESDIPIAVGLKSSSSAAVAVGLAVLDALGESMSPEDFLAAVAEASQRSGVSITGAIDDAAGCMLGGVVLTDNYGRKILRRDSVEGDLMVAILIPEKRTYTREFRKELLTPIRDLVMEAFKIAERGDYWRAMTLNGILHATALNISPQPILDALNAGALGAGVSGTGPAIAAVTKLGTLKAVETALSRHGSRVEVKRVVNPKGRQP
ncbi:MAG: shikimate kinase [Nitrososphaerota archaeon]|nr:shikimate kinase [Candidatus Calditenuaceae archaeon]MDW8074078.1 shikimate kinase [Nitrososphaerota archaeon]